MKSAEWECIHQPNNVVAANYLLLIENLLDISHFYPLHDGNIGDAAHSEIPVEFDFASIDGNRSIKCIRQAKSYHHPPYLADFFGYELVDRYHTHAMVSPGIVRVAPQPTSLPWRRAPRKRMPGCSSACTSSRWLASGGYRLAR